MNVNDPNYGHDSLPIVAYSKANEMGLHLVGALKELCVLKGYVAHGEGTLLVNTDEELAPGVAEALCTLAEAFNF